MVYRYPLGNTPHPEALKEKQRSPRDGFQKPLGLRVHRALSWLRQAEAEDEDHDVRLVLLWIGFYAAYAGDVEASASSSAPEGERGLIQEFFSGLGEVRRPPPDWKRTVPTSTPCSTFAVSFESRPTSNGIFCGCFLLCRTGATIMDADARLIAQWRTGWFLL